MKVTSLFMDIVKALDCVNHRILVQKLVKADVCGSASGFTQSFINNRIQCVDVNGRLSWFREVKQGVPQGYLLALRFFWFDFLFSYQGFT